MRWPRGFAAFVCTAVLGVAAADARAADYQVSPFATLSYEFSGRESGSNATLHLVRGETYTFEINASNHPFLIQTAPGINPANIYSTGVTNNGVQVGVLTFSVPASAPDRLFYQCGFHGLMTGTIEISGPIVAVPSEGPVGRALLALLLLALGPAALRARRRRLAP